MPRPPLHLFSFGERGIMDTYRLTCWLRTPLAELAYRPETDLSLEVITPSSLQDMGSFSQLLEQATPPAINERGSTLYNDSVVAQSPLAVLDTVSGFSLAEDVLGRIEWGLVG